MREGKAEHGETDEQQAAVGLECFDLENHSRDCEQAARDPRDHHLGHSHANDVRRAHNPLEIEQIANSVLPLVNEGHAVQGRIKDDCDRNEYRKYNSDDSHLEVVIWHVGRLHDSLKYRLDEEKFDQAKEQGPANQVHLGRVADEDEGPAAHCDPYLAAE